MSEDGAAPTHPQPSRVVLLGPQRQPTVDQVVRDLGGDGPLATVTAGWQEREPDDQELDELLAGRSANLALYGRWLEVQQHDPEFAAAELAHRALLDELRTLHLVQLDAALTALHTLTQRNGDRAAAIDAAVADAEAVIRLLDDRHAERLQDARAEFDATMSTYEREAIAGHRELVRKMLEQSAALFLAGGHVGELLRMLRLFGVADTIPDTVVAWSAGAMCLTERVVLFHDRTPQGVAPPEVFDEGMGVLPALVVLPDASRRLQVDDQGRMAEISRRFAPAACLVLDRGDRVEASMMTDAEPGVSLPPSARTVAADGRIVSEGES